MTQKIQKLSIHLLLGIFLLGLGLPTIAQEIPNRLAFADLSLEIQASAQSLMAQELENLLKNEGNYLHKSEIAALFLPIVSEILLEADLPNDFKYLALLDNNTPDSLIFWQMAEGLAIDLGLEISDQVDERKNIIATTQAVAKYLKKNHQELNNWVFTLLSLRIPKNQIKDYLKAQFPTLSFDQIAQKDTFKIDEQTPKEILEVLVYKIAFDNALEAPVSPKTELISYEEGQGKSLNEIAQDFSLPLAELSRFNSWLKTNTIPTNKIYPVVIPMPTESPSSQVAIYTSNAGEIIYETPGASFLHTVESGQTLYRISRIYDVSVEELMRWNRLNSNSLAIGQQLIIFKPEEVEETPPPPAYETRIHIVARGENLFRISREYNVTVSELRAWNGLFTDRLYVGQKLKVKLANAQPPKIDPPVSSPQPSPSPAPKPNKPAPSEEQEPDGDVSITPTPGSGDVSQLPPQNPKRIIPTKYVPSEMKLGDVHLRITREAQKLIQKDVDLLTRSNTYLLKKLRRTDVYMPIVESILEANNIPTDFKFLPIQESAFIANAVSRSKAVGYWQFKEASGVEVGMTIDNKVDERMHIQASTEGAVKYFKRNNLYFKNWVFTLLSFNMGFGGAKNYFRNKYPGKKPSSMRNLTIDEHTHWYIRKFLAHKIVFENEVQRERPNYRLSLYKQGSGKSLKQIAQEIGNDTETMKSFNRWLKRNKIPGGKTYTVIVPK